MPLTARRDCKKRCGQPGLVCDTAGTALALLPFLGNGETHLTSQHAEVVAKGLRWLIAHEGPDGRWIESVYTEKSRPRDLDNRSV